MNNMFANAERFNQNIGNWNTGRLISMRSMFSGAANFNNGQPAGVGGTFHWNTGIVTDMSFMFQNAQAFNQNISNWDVSAVTENNFYNFRDGSALTQFLLPLAFR